MEQLSLLIIILFILSTVFTIWQFYSASGKSKIILTGVSILLLVQGALGYTGFFRQTQVMPPPLVFLLGPPMLTIIVLFATERGRTLLDTFSLRALTLLHAVRIPVEITLYFLFVAHLVPRLMTFEGNNYDILSGLTALMVYYLMFVIKKVNRKILLIWNFICLGLLLNIVTIALLSASTPFQKLAFDQPNVGITYFPFVWLPGLIVPIVFFSHLISIRQLLTLSHSIQIAKSKYT